MLSRVLPRRGSPEGGLRALTLTLLVCDIGNTSTRICIVRAIWTNDILCLGICGVRDAWLNRNSDRASLNNVGRGRAFAGMDRGGITPTID